MYHLDGSELVLTHYCMEGNQPRMRAKKTDGARLDFAADGGTNIDPPQTATLNSAWIEFVGPDEIRNQWTEIADGQAGVRRGVASRAQDTLNRQS